jgi:hypothetical protein
LRGLETVSRGPETISGPWNRRFAAAPYLRRTAAPRPRCPATGSPSPRPDLAREADRFARALDTPEGRAASGLDAAAFAGLAALVADLRAAVTARAGAEAARRAAVVVQRAAHRAATARLRALRRQASGHTAMTDDLRAAAGLPLVAGLTALRRPSGAVFLDWTGPTGGALRYEVFGRDPDGAGAGAWRLLGAATGTDFVDRTAPPGRTRVYRVEPCRGARRGEPSGEAAVTF